MTHYNHSEENELSNHNQDPLISCDLEAQRVNNTTGSSHTTRSRIFFAQKPFHNNLLTVHQVCQSINLEGEEQENGTDICLQLYITLAIIFISCPSINIVVTIIKTNPLNTANVLSGKLLIAVVNAIEL